MIKQRAAKNALPAAGEGTPSDGKQDDTITDSAPEQPDRSAPAAGEKKIVNNITSRTIFLDHLIMLLTQTGHSGAAAAGVPEAMQRHVQALVQRATADAPTQGPPQNGRFQQVRT